jgi:hypothetical protein
MSIVALKRKTEARYGRHGVAGDGFSLNGRTRFLGPVNPHIAPTVTRTPFKGVEPKGHGGGARCRVRGIKGRASHCSNNETYVKSIVRSTYPTTPQTLVKRSTFSESGKLELQRMNTLDKVGCHWFKPAGLDVSEVPRVCFDPKPYTAPSCSGNCPVPNTKPPVFTPLSYDQYYYKLDGKTKLCALPAWPPRVLNGFCAPVWQRSSTPN